MNSLIRMRFGGKYAWILGIWLSLAGMVSCDLNKIDFNDDDSSNVKNETISDSYLEDATSISSTAISVPTETNGGRRIFTIADNRLSCASIYLDPSVGSKILHPKGVITVDFLGGCSDGRGNRRKGKILITYDGKRFLPGSSVIITFDGYEINGVKIEGKHTLTNASESTQADPRYTITLDSGKLTWPDGTTAFRATQHTFEWVRTAGGVDDQLIVTGSATGVNRKGHSYSLTILEKLVYQKACIVANAKFLASQGKEELIVNNKKVDIDFGNGSCSETVTISINGKSTSLDLSNGN